MKALSKEVAGTLLLKVLLLYLLWYVCFSHPVSKQIGTDQLAERLLNSKQVVSVISDISNHSQ